MLNSHADVRRRACYLVNLGFDEEQFNECGRALNGCVDIFESQRLLVNHVVVLSEEVLHPE